MEHYLLAAIKQPVDDADRHIAVSRWPDIYEALAIDDAPTPTGLDDRYS